MQHELPASGRLKYGAWIISILAAIGLLGAISPGLIEFYACPDWDLKNNPACSVWGLEIGQLVSLGSLYSSLLLGFCIFVAPVLLLLLVAFSFLGGKK